jgi:hypothetical protein
MKKSPFFLLLIAGLAVAQDKAPETVKRLDSVTWDLNTHKLVWVVQTGTQVNGEFTPVSSSRYEVSPDEASMSMKDEKRGFTEEEAASLHHLLDVLSLYCAESTVWWDQGQGDPMEKAPTQQKTTTKTSPDSKPVKVKEQQSKPPAEKKPVPLSIPALVAAVQNR